MLDPGSDPPRRWTRSRIVTLIATVLTAAAYVAQIEVARNLPFWAHAIIVACGASSAAIAIFLPFREEIRQRKLTEDAKLIGQSAATQLSSGLQDRLIHVALKLTEIQNVNPASRALEKDKLKQLTISLASGRVRLDSSGKTVTLEDARACFYTYYRSPKERLVCENNMWQGRGPQPPRRLGRDTPIGTAMLNLVKEKESKRLSADQLVASGGWDDCETLIATPVIAGDKIFGMLTLDAPKVGDLLEVELAAMRLYAQLLAAGLAS